MTDTTRETLEKVAKGYNDLLVLQAQQRALQAEMIRACVVAIKRQPTPSENAGRKRRIIRDRADAFEHLEKLAVMLEAAK